MKYILNNDNFEVVGKQYLNGVGNYDGTNPNSYNDIATVLPNMVEVTYEQLKDLRDNHSRLVPGQQYRITDYVTTTSARNTRSAGNQFDIIVTALDKKTLSEEARAIKSETAPDSYFNDVNFSAWKIWYSLDNDVERFAWADIENGKGVIYRMIDEYGNDCPYDFKNIMFGLPTDWFAKERGTNWANNVLGYVPDTVKYFYTFDWEDQSHISGDYSILANDGSILDEEGYNAGCYNNIVKKVSGYRLGVSESLYALPCNIFVSTQYYGEGFSYGVYSNTLGNDCYSNTFGNDCFSNTFGDRCTQNILGNQYGLNTFGDNCSSNTFGDQCTSNTFGDQCTSNTFGDNCSFNTFGDQCKLNKFKKNCSSNVFWDSCTSNTFGSNCTSNTFGDWFRYNTFGSNCTSNTFGDSCTSNTFGNQCFSNNFGDQCFSNTFGSNCTSNTFGDSCESNNFGDQCTSNTLGDIYSSNTFGNKCSSNTSGDNCDLNTFGDQCSSNTFGDNCSSNTFGKQCISNTFGDNCSSNTLGNQCSFNTFGNNCESNNLGDMFEDNTDYQHVVYIRFDDDCNNNILARPTGQYAYKISNIKYNSNVSHTTFDFTHLNNQDGTLQNIIISSGVKGTNTSRLSIDPKVVNQNYEVRVAMNSSGVLKVYCEADLIN